jgi:hypothetical protein
MAWFEDLAACDYFSFHLPALRAIGWLERGKPFSVGEVQPEVYAALREMTTAPWRPVTMMGWHSCDLCLYEPATHGSDNLFIPGDGVIYVCPALITHYMNVHAYQPPAPFCRAVLECPSMGSTAYLRAVQLIVTAIEQSEGWSQRERA